MAKCIESIGSLGNSTGKHVTLPKKASPLDFRILYINVWILYREIELNQSSSRDTEVTFASHVAWHLSTWYISHLVIYGVFRLRENPTQLWNWKSCARLTWLIPPLGLEDIISSALVMEEQFVGGYLVDGGCGWWLVGRFTMSWTMSRTKVRPFLASPSTLRSISARWQVHAISIRTLWPCRSHKICQNICVHLSMLQ
jgi:hypothetical protein